ncbi:hypothetical protein A6P54_16290 [Bacillus sp. MKU004]|nr:hypothetical protein A6P54_16290 [Bacillus sp. MKU004]
MIIKGRLFSFKRYILYEVNLNSWTIQQLIGVEDEDSYQKSERALLRGVWHKTNRPSWSVWLMTCASKPCSWPVPIPWRLPARPRKAKSSTEIHCGIENTFEDSKKHQN